VSSARKTNLDLRRERENFEADLVRSLFNYDFETGVLTWKVRKANCVQIGQTAGSMGTTGYLVVMISGRTYTVHRIVWLLVTGKWPKCDLDHIDRDRANNRFSNLREANRSQNCANRTRSSNNTSGVKGVHWLGRKNRWQARITVDGKRLSLGSYRNLEDAQAAYAKAALTSFREYSFAN